MSWIEISAICVGALWILGLTRQVNVMSVDLHKLKEKLRTHGIDPWA